MPTKNNLLKVFFCKLPTCHSNLIRLRLHFWKHVVVVAVLCGGNGFDEAVPPPVTANEIAISDRRQASISTSIRIFIFISLFIIITV